MAETPAASTARPDRGAETGDPGPGIRRRWFLQAVGAVAAAPWLARADTVATSPLALPLHLEQIVNHIGISVSDVVRSARFYSHLFDGPTILGQVKPALRYSVELYPGAMAIGALRPAAVTAGARGFIDHFCVAARPFDLAAWRARLDRDGLRYFAHGTFVEIGDIPVQLLGGRAASTRPPGASQAGAAAGGFAPMPPLYRGAPLVTAHGFEHVIVQVSDLDGATALFRKLFGLVPQWGASGSVSFGLGGVRLGLRSAAGGEKPSIASFAIRVSPFDGPKLTDALSALGAQVEPVERHLQQTVLRFADPDGIACELWTV